MVLSVFLVSTVSLAIVLSYCGTNPENCSFMLRDSSYVVIMDDFK